MREACPSAGSSPMTIRLSIRVALWSALAGGLVAIGTFLLLDWLMPGEVTIEPALGGEIVVEVDGAVATPGIVRLPAGSRLHDAIDATGGLAPDADTTSLNLAARIGDGERVDIPIRTSLADLATPFDSGGEGLADDPVGALIDINNAGVSELDQLPGVGPVIAERIVDYREINGPFSSIEELGAIEGISLEMAEELRPMVTLGE